MTVRTFLAALVMALFCSCSRPVSDEMFVKNSDRDEYGRYEYLLQMDDSLKRYDIDFIFSMEGNSPDIQAFTNLPFHILLSSPSGRLYEEKIWVTREMIMEDSDFSKRFCAHYRSELEPYERGEWRLYLDVPDEDLKKYSILGIGLRLIRKD